MENRIKFLDLFAGCGGLTEGFLQTDKYDEVAAVEWLKPQVDTLRHRLNEKWGYKNADSKVMHFDIQRENELYCGWNDKVFGTSEGLDHFVNCSNGIDMVIGGPPCQAYSVAGRIRDEDGMRNDYRNYLFEHYLNVVSRYQPTLFVFENVPGMLSAKPGDRLVSDLVTEGFANIGYEIISDLKKYAVVNAKEYGVPQSRKRVIIVGIRKESVPESVNIQSLLTEFYLKVLPKYKVEKEKTVIDSIGDLPKFHPIKDNGEMEKRISHILISDVEKSLTWQKPRFQNKRDIEIFRMLAKDIEDGTELYTNSKALSEVYKKKVGSMSTIHRYHVLRPDRPSTTIIAHLHKDGNRFIHYDSEQARTITPREAARLQTFDDDFDFIGSQGAVYQMIGNAVPPKLAKAIANATTELMLKVKKYKPNLAVSNID